MDSMIVKPAREPYAYLICNIKNHGLTYLFPMPEDAMDSVITDWEIERNKGGTVTFDQGAEGVWHIAAGEVLFFKRITQAEAEEMKSAANRARAGLGLR
jgi:hypothetical protein